jgi:hypothetical protein
VKGGGEVAKKKKLVRRWVSFSSAAEFQAFEKTVKAAGFRSYQEWERAQRREFVAARTAAA